MGLRDLEVCCKIVQTAVLMNSLEIDFTLNINDINWVCLTIVHKER